MAEPPSPSQLAPTPEQRRVAVGQFERAEEVLSSGNNDYAIRLLLNCCKLDPANLIYRKALRQAQKARHDHNLRGSPLALLTTIPARLRLRTVMARGDHLRVLEFAERVLVRNPWDVGAQVAMAEAFQALGLIEQAVWALEEIRQKDQNNTRVNRSLARLYERRGNFRQSIALWELVRKANPGDLEAYDKAKDLAARETIVRGGYVQALVERSGPTAAPAQEEYDPADEVEQRPAVHREEPKPAPQDRFSREVRPWLQRLEEEPGDVQAYLKAVGVYRRADRLEEARTLLVQGLEKTGNRYELQIELAELDIEPFRQDLAHAESRLRAEPDDEELRKIRVKLLKEINTRELYLFGQKAERFPTEMEYRFELGLRLLRAGQLDEAIRELQAARTDPRFQARALYYLGHAFRGRNNWRLSRRNFEEALEHLPDTEEALRKETLFHLAQGAADAGEMETAIEFGTELANIDFWHRDIGKLLDVWQEELKSEPEA